MALNLDQDNSKRAHSQSFAKLTKYTNNNTLTVHTWTWMNENSQERGKTWEKMCFKV